MKRKPFLNVLIAILGSSTFTSCSNDDDENVPDSPNSGKCRISSANCETVDPNDPDYGWISRYSDFKFGSNGMIEGYKAERSDDDYVWNERYSYSSNSIRVGDEDGTIVTYNLENGLITSAEDMWNHTWNYVYDDDKHLVKIIDGDWTYTCTWKEGNLISYEKTSEWANLSNSISYTNKINTLGFLPVEIYDEFLDDDDGRMFDSILCAQGYFGEMPNNLPSKAVGNTVSEGQETIQINYSDFNKYGYPEVMNVDFYYGSSGTISFSKNYKFTWDK